MRALALLDEGDVKTAAALRECGIIKQASRLDYLAACLAAASGNAEEAHEALCRVQESEETLFFTRFRATAALEKEAQAAGDYKSAYQYSTKRAALLEQFSK